MTGLAQTLRVARRDLAIESSSHHLAVAALPFVLSAAVLAGLAFGPRPATLVAVGPGLVWLLVLFATVPLTRGIVTAERDEGCWDLLRAIVPPGRLLAGKVAAVWVWLTGVWAVSSILVTALFANPVRAAGLAAGPVATLGLAVAAVLFGLLVSDAVGGERLLAVLLLPAGLPTLLAATQLGLGSGSAATWLALLVVYDVIAVTVAWALFPVLLVE